MEVFDCPPRVYLVPSCEREVGCVPLHCFFFVGDCCSFPVLPAGVVERKLLGPTCVSSPSGRPTNTIGRSVARSGRAAFCR
jgi:hypothetical protein